MPPNNALKNLMLDPTKTAIETVGLYYLGAEIASAGYARAAVVPGDFTIAGGVMENSEIIQWPEAGGDWVYDEVRAHYSGGGYWSADVSGTVLTGERLGAAVGDLRFLMPVVQDGYYISGEPVELPPNSLFKLDVRDLALTVGDPISSWDIFSQATPIYQPTLMEDIDGKFARFSTSYMIGPNNLINDKSHLWLYVILKARAINSELKAIFFASTGNGQNFTRAGFFHTNNNIEIAGRRLDSDPYSSVLYDRVNVDLWQTHTCSLDWPDRKRFGYHGTGLNLIDESFSTGGGNSDSIDSQTVLIGSAPDGTNLAHSPLQMDLKFMVAYDREITAQDALDVQLWGASNFGVI